MSNGCTPASMIPDLRCGRGIPLLQPHEYPQAQAFSQARHLFDKPVQLNRTGWDSNQLRSLPTDSRKSTKVQARR